MHPELSKHMVYRQLEEALGTEGLFGPRMRLEEVGYPTLYVRFLNRRDDVRLLRIEATDYDFVPLAVEPVDPETRNPLPAESWMRRSGGNFPGHTMNGGRPFLCIAGTRDYYTYEGHRPQITGDRWERWREEFKMRDLLRLIQGKFASGEWE